MPFPTRCPYCRRRVRVPDRALAASVKCPSCESWYTATQENERERSEKSVPLVSTPPAPPPNPVAPHPPDVPAATAAPAATGTAVAETQPPAPALFIIQNLDEAEPQEVAEANTPRPLGVIACLLAGAALIAASMESTAILTRPAAGLGLVLGVIGVFAVSGGNQGRSLLSIGGTAVSGLVLLVAVLQPSLLGPRYEASRQTSDNDAEAVRVVALQLAPGGADGLESDGYADASRAAVQQGSFRVQILSAAVAPVQVFDSKKRFTKRSFLAIKVRVQHLGHAEDVRFTHWGTTGERTVPQAVAHAEGRTLPPANLDPDVPLGVAFGRDLFRGDGVEDVLLFEVPPGSVPVRLDLPAEAWGVAGVVVKFQIPASMIATQSAKKPK
jgi:hypothetical protein